MRDVRVSTRALMVLCVALCVLAITQSGSGESSIPRIVRYSGCVPRLAGHMASVRVSFYAAEGGAPLWAETQNVNFEANGGFTVLIGAQSTDGIPSFLFEAGVARWIGIEAEGEELHPRTMLLSVPYAIKAGDADTLGGKPFSAFVLASIASTASAAAEQIKASTTAPTSGAAAYVDNNYAEVLLVQQNGGGFGLHATSTSNAAVVGESTNNTGAAFYGISHATSGGTVGIRGDVASDEGAGLFGIATSRTGPSYGVRGDVASDSGTGVLGFVTSSTGPTVGIRGLANSNAGMGVRADAAATSGSTIGVYSQVMSPNGVAGMFNNRAGGKVLSILDNWTERLSVDTGGNLSTQGNVRLTGAGTGVVFPDGSVQRSAATNSTVITGSTPTGTLQVTQTGAGLSVTPTQQDPPAAVRGAATATLGSVAGIGGESISPAGYGVLGLNSASSGDATGVAGYSTQSPYGIGVYGEASSTDASAAPTGVLGVVNGTGVGASGVWGDASGTSGLTTGVYGDAFSPDGYGVEGDAYATTGIAIGVAGFSDSDQGRGVMGNATSPTGQTYGVRGLTASDAGTGVAGVSNSTTGATVGVSGDVSSASGVAGLFTNSGGGDILVGRTGAGTNVFRLDSTGKGFFSGGTQTGGADFAENFAVRGQKQEYEPGDLLAIDETGARRLRRTDAPYSTLVAGVYSTKPGVLAQPYSIDSRQGESEVPLAMVGVVPLKVTTANGIIAAGDLLVSSSIEGRAMKGTDRTRMLGAVVGKALEACRNGEKTILVLVTLQ